MRFSSERRDEDFKKSSRVISSVGRAPPLQGGGRQFDPVITHHNFLFIEFNEKLKRLMKFNQSHFLGV